MGFDRRDDKGDQVHRTVPVFGTDEIEESPTEAARPREESLVETDAPQSSSSSTLERLPVPITSPLPEPGVELPSVIAPGAGLLNKYRGLKDLGHGGMGSVWLVEHLGFGEKRALKVIHAVFAADPKVRARFRQEAKILAKL